MPAFNVGTAVEQLDWDFTGRKPDGTFFPDWPKALENAKGTLREPSDKMIGDFLEGMKTLYRDNADLIGVSPETGEEPDPERMLELLDAVSGDDFVELMHRLAILYARLCGAVVKEDGSVTGGHPTLKQIEALPMRGRSAFYTWIMQEVVRPEVGNNGGAQVVNLRPTAATG